MNNDDDNDKDLFQKAVKDVKPLRSDKRSHRPPAPAVKIRQTQQESESFYPLSNHETESVSGEQTIDYAQSGVQPRTLRRLKQGKMTVEAELDLHGKTVDEAREQLVRFIESCQQQGLRVLRVIHGKGSRGHDRKPIIKNKVNSWLRQLPFTLAFCSCQPRDGGTGAVYVLLKR